MTDEKKNLVEYLKTLGLEPETEMTLINYIETRDLDQKLLDQVADVLDYLAAVEEVRAKLIAGQIAQFEALDAKLAKLSGELDEKSDSLIKGIVSKFEGVVEELKAMPTEAAPMDAPMEPSAVETTSVMPAAPSM